MHDAKNPANHLMTDLCLNGLLGPSGAAKVCAKRDDGWH